MKKIIISILLLLPVIMMAQFSVSSDLSYDYGKDYSIENIDAVVVLERLDTSNVLSYVFPDSTVSEWHYHTASSDSLIASSQVNDTIARLDSLQQGLYELRLTSRSYYYYVLDFSEYQGVIDSVWVDDSGDSCNYVRLYATLNNPTIPVYDKLSDSTYLLANPSTDFVWYQDSIQENAGSKYRIDAPYQDITYGCSPYSADFFSNEYRVNYTDADTAYAEPYTAIAVNLLSFTYELPDTEEGYLSNKLVKSTATSGSAPLNVNYSIEYQGAADFTAWWVWEANNDQPNSPTYRYQDQVTHTFTKYVADPGYRVKVMVGNDFCQVSDSVDVTVTESQLEVPNILVLGWGSVGQFKVAYQSIDPSSFKAAIYDRKGRLIHKWQDPERGWDGRSPLTGAYVSPGAYYYSIQAKGTDGKDYKLAGAVNVVREKGIK